MSTRRGRSGSFWPSRQQELLLRVALLEDEDAERAWGELIPRLDIQRLEAGSTVLLPLLYERLRDNPAAEPFLPRLKGVYRYVWYRNQVAMKALSEMLELLGGARVEAIVFGGAALTACYYRNVGVRPIDEASVLVHAHQRQHATTSLLQAGWTLASGSGRSNRMHPADALDGQVAALHWQLPVEFDPARRELSDVEVWRDANASEVQGISTMTLDPGDELLLTCVRGVRSSGTSNVQWIADAMTILRVSGSEIDWEALIAKAARQRRTVPLLEALRYLTEALNAAIPQSALKKLEGTPVTGRERLAQRISGRGGLMLGNLPATVGAHVVASEDKGALRTVLTLPTFVRTEWGVDRASQLPLAAARRAAAGIAGIRARRRTRQLAQRQSSASSSGS